MSDEMLSIRNNAKVATALDALAAYVEGINHAEGLEHPYQMKLVFNYGKRWVKAVSISQFGNSTSCYAFIDPITGDMFKPAGWNKPAPHARANLFDPESWKKGCTRYGMAYLK